MEPYPLTSNGLSTFSRIHASGWTKHFVSCTKITTKLEWEDVVLDQSVLNQLMEIQTWLEHGENFNVGLGLDKHQNPSIVHYSMVPWNRKRRLQLHCWGKFWTGCFIKWICPWWFLNMLVKLKKKLGKVFRYCQHHKWILFFWWGRCLFGKRTLTKTLRTIAMPTSKYHTYCNALKKIFGEL